MQKLILKIANKYNKSKGFNKIKKDSKIKLDKGKAFLIASQYNKMKSCPNNIEVKKTYRQFKKELIAQYKELKKHISFEFTSINPYKNSQEMFQDLEQNKRLKVFTGGEYHQNMGSVNVIFRAVHDVLGHYINYNSFSANGEYKAYKHHFQMFSPLARVALFTESIGQVCYYSVNKKYAEQKSILFNNYFINLV